MSRLTQVSNEIADEKVQKLFSAVQGKLGMVPNMMRALGNSSAALEAYLQFSGTLSHGSLSGKQREQIALVVGQTNACDYCLAAHTALGKMAGLSSDQIRDSRLGTAIDSKTEALLQFAKLVVETRGRVNDDDVDQLRTHGFTEGDITEVVANVALNIFTNYFNHVAETDIDFPRAAALVDNGATVSN